VVTLPHAAVGQDEATIEQLARLLEIEDTRRFDAAVLQAGAEAAEAVVRRRTALALGRLGSDRALPLLLTLLTDPDSTVQRDAAFALGQLGDAQAVAPLREQLIDGQFGSDPAVALEVVTALSKLGGAGAAGILGDLMQQGLGAILTDSAPPPGVLRAVEEAWRLGADAPVATIIQAAAAPNALVRRAAAYSLSRLRATEANAVLLNAVNDVDPLVRSYAVRALTAEYADSGDADRSALSAVVVRAVDDPVVGVRIQALRALGSYADSSLARVVLDRLTDPNVGVRVQALATLGALGGADAATALRTAASGREFAIGREGLLGLVRVDRTMGVRAAAAWITSQDWRKRLAGAEALRILGGDTALAWLESLVEDSDPRVAARAYAELVIGDSVVALELARGLLDHADPVMRTIAANQIAREPTIADVPLLADAFRRAGADPVPDAAVAVVEALGALAALGPSQAFAVEDRFLTAVEPSDDYLIRRAAAERLPIAADRWGPAYPVVTGRAIGDYREIVRRLLLPSLLDGANPGLVIETDRGTIEIELFAGDAPLTVNAVLELVDRRYYSGFLWHRVVPDFVVQDGDPRGDGWGGPGTRLRDEVNRRRFDEGAVGMALSGPDTGGSQYFITLAPQPHLDGRFTVFGAVSQGGGILDVIAQGDRIQIVRRR
jgi:cyclophilin family peptidyl-prolyl cis-trans isomerase/HEAT repeat protein